MALIRVPFQDGATSAVIVAPEDYDYRAMYEKYARLESFNRTRHPVGPPVVKPGDQFRVTAFSPEPSESLSVKRAINFATEKGQVLVGTEGLLFVCGQIRERLPRQRWYLSLDEGTNDMVILLVQAHGGIHFSSHPREASIKNTVIFSFKKIR